MENDSRRDNERYIRPMRNRTIEVAVILLQMQKYSKFGYLGYFGDCGYFEDCVCLGDYGCFGDRGDYGNRWDRGNCGACGDRGDRRE